MMKKTILIFTIISLFFTSCNTDLDINRDPDSVNEVSLKSQLPAGIAGIIGAEGSYYAIIGGFWSQYWTQSNSSNQYKDIDGYTIGSGDFFAAWRNMYDALGDIRNVKRVAKEKENWNYYLIATVLEAQASQVLTDFYGSVPFTQANNQSILEPKYDTGEEIYAAMISNLDDALSKTLSSSLGEKPSTDDLIFGGDMDNWTKFANTMKLKIYMRQINSARSSIAVSGINSLLTSGVSFLDVDAGMNQFVDAPSQSNPLYETDRRQLNTTLNLRMSRTMSSYFDLNSDPRKAMYYGAGNPLDQGDFESTIPQTSIAVVTLKPTTPAYLMTKEESLFLQAEAQARYGTNPKSLYDEAVTENFNKYSLNASSFLVTGGAYEFPSSGTLDDKIKAIMMQKWIAGFPGNGFEAFFDANRTGYPKKSLVPQSDPAYIPGELAYSINGSTNGKFPKRIVYPQEEINTNSNTPALQLITDKIWWE